MIVDESEGFGKFDIGMFFFKGFLGGINGWLEGQVFGGSCFVF